MIKLTILSPYHICCYYRKSNHFQTTTATTKNQNMDIGIIHMNSYMNGGGEKVLWTLINGLLANPNYKVTLYYDGDFPKHSMLENVEKYFGVKIPPEDLNIIPIKSGWILRSGNYFFLSRYLEAFSQIVITPSLLHQFITNHDLVIETMTAHFTLSFVKIFARKTRTLSYVHYPFTTIETPNAYLAMISSCKGISKFVKIPF